MQIQISWLLKKPTDLDLHCLQRQGISGFIRTRVKYFKQHYVCTQIKICLNQIDKVLVFNLKVLHHVIYFLISTRKYVQVLITSAFLRHFEHVQTIYIFWEKQKMLFISIQKYWYFSYFSTKTYVVGTYRKWLGEIRKIFTTYPLLFRPM